MKEVIVALLIGSAAGVLGGMFGIGGGILIVPALVFTLGFGQLRAQGTSLVALLAPVGILALRQYYKSGEADLKLGAIIALGFFIGGYFGSKVSLGLDPLLMRRVFAAFLLVVGASLLVTGK